MVNLQLFVACFRFCEPVGTWSSECGCHYDDLVGLTAEEIADKYLIPTARSLAQALHEKMGSTPGTLYADSPKYAGEPSPP